MRAVRLHSYDQPLRLDEVPEPRITSPHDVIVRVAGAGLCRTDLHLQQGWFAPLGLVELPFTLGHENAGWIHEVGTAVANVAVGDTVICHPQLSCGICPACRRGEDMQCTQGLNFTGLTREGGFAELLKTTDRAVLRLPSGLEPSAVAPHADAGLTVMHVVRKTVPVLEAGTRVIVVGIGGLGHIAIQCLRALTPAEIIAVDADPEALKLAADCGAHHLVPASDQAAQVRDITGGAGAEAVIDFVGEDASIGDALNMVRTGGSYYVVGYGGTLSVPAMQLVLTQVSVVGSAVGTHDDLRELMALAVAGAVNVRTRSYPLEAFAEALDDLQHGRMHGRGVLVP